MQKTKPEILAPAGNFEKMKAAIAFGADAVYLAGNTFGMRSAAGNFTDEEITEAVKYAHERGVKVYITVNTMPRTNEYKRLEEYIKFLGSTGADALIISDLGVFMLAKETVPDTPGFLPGKAHGQRSLMTYSPWVTKIGTQLSE